MSTATITRVMGGPVSNGFEAIFREHYRLIYSTAFHITGSHQDAEDVLQTIFLRLLRSDLPRDFNSNPKGYLYRAAVNASLDSIRARQRQILTEKPDWLDGPESPSIDAEVHRQLHAAIAQLHPNAAQILILRYVHNYSDAEIAKLLGTSRGTIAVSLYRSRARLKKIIRSCFAKETSHEKK